LHLDRTRGEREIAFDDVKVNTGSKDQIEFVLANQQGELVRLLVPRATLKQLVSWKMLMSL
jgi:hypothetical protein